ncbi:hypothetical protein [Pedobacter sp. SYSU D00535]|uniref:hypothetical protein n=1 Tax=Pedobacter sp. SYSU D00535 TaxID=2810308 RepID=UPI001A968FBB|nr:hypothetical protein [Pedobacter sp. SYSU D00535]
MKILLSFAVLALLLSSCIGTKRYHRYLSEGYKTSSGIPAANSANLSIKQNPQIVDTELSTKNKKSQFIPAIILWQWEKSISCSLAEKHQANKVESYLRAYADTLQLEQSLKGRQLEITIESAPANFTYTSKGHVLFLFLAYATSVSESISPEYSDLRLSYKLLTDNQISKQGEITVLDKNEAVANRWKSTRKFSRYYLDRYENNVKAMSKDAIVKLAKEI